MKSKILSMMLICGLSLPALAGNNEDLIEACKKGDLAAAQKAIDGGADVNFKAPDGMNPLGAAFFWPQITQLLVDKKADPNMGTAPALVNAAGQGSYEVMQILLAAGADPNKPMVVDATATYKKLLEDEKAKGKDKNKYIIKAYEDLIAKAAGGNLPTIYALQNLVNRTICSDGLQLLIDKGAKTDLVDANTNGNLLDVVALSALPTKDWIENNKVQVQGWEKLGYTVPDWYKNPSGHLTGSIDAMVKSLVKAGVNINAKNKLGNTPLLSSLGRFTQTREEVALAFVNNGGDINDESKTEGHPLLQAAGYGFVDVLNAMFAKGADMNREFKVDDWIKTGQRIKGITPLMWAAKNGKLDAVRMLAEKGAKLNEAGFGTSFNIKTGCLTSVKGKTAIYYAIEGGNLDVVKYLVENTAGEWKKELTIEQWTHKTEDAQFIYISCLKDKDYSPSEYAKANKLDDITDYLKGKKL